MTNGTNVPIVGNVPPVGRSDEDAATWAVTYITDPIFEQNHRIDGSVSIAFYYGADLAHRWQVEQSFYLVRPGRDRRTDLLDGSLYALGRGVIEELPRETYATPEELFAAWGRATGFRSATQLATSMYATLRRQWRRALRVVIVRQLEWLPEGHEVDVGDLTADRGEPGRRVSSSPYRKIPADVAARRFEAALR
jgi:hypothetical protein